ncbi:MAG TPA: ATP-binding cassette domain-containing protein [Kofleriaceae bacterium]|jgi:phospholipid/cholesterol/gamma-HCH transport system ATP-binding protein|nr:ATP-binding cassette domain-containing protein [Kofleriaceae bacterium]
MPARSDDVLLACNDIAVGYDDKPVLEHVDLEIHRGEIVTLLGGSGCGKSTLLRAITGLLPPRSGTVTLLGEDLYATNDDGRRLLLRRTGMAFQQDALFSAITIIDNVALPLRELTKLPESLICEMARIKLALVGLSGLEHRLPASLSGGQRKRAALARASILDPEIIFADEPSAGLDPIVAAELDETLRRFRDVLGVTVVVVTHELASIRAIADRAIMFGSGKVMAVGTVAELEGSHDEGVYNFFHARAS